MVDICRLCMNDNPVLDVFDDDLHTLIASYLGIVISEQDAISRKVCDGCSSMLVNFRDFKAKCLEVQQTLQNYSHNLLEETVVTLDDAHHLEVFDHIQYHPDLAGSVEAEHDYVEVPVSPNEKSHRFQKIEISESGRRRYIYDLKETYKSQLVECETCGKNIAKVRMEGHRNMHAGIRPFQCERGCEANFHCRQLRLHHYRNVHVEQPHKCDICQNVYRSKRSLSYHQKDVHSPKTLVCPVCKQAFVSNARLKQHMKFHTASRNFPCSICPHSFHSNHDLKKHQKRVHDTSKAGSN